MDADRCFVYMFLSSVVLVSQLEDSSLTPHFFREGAEAQVISMVYLLQRGLTVLEQGSQTNSKQFVFFTSRSTLSYFPRSLQPDGYTSTVVVPMLVQLLVYCL